MHVQGDDLGLEALREPLLRVRLARQDWEHDPEFVPAEQVLRLLRRARESGNDRRVGLFTETLSRRLLKLAKGFAQRSGVYPGLIGDLDQAAEELSQFVWECLVSRPKDAAYGENYFGQLFKRRALDFQKRLVAKKRKLQVSLDAMDHSPEDDDPEKTLREVAGLREETTPAEALEKKQEYAQVAARLQAILTKNEHSVFVMLHVNEMSVKDVAVALGVTPRTINNYKNAALEKIRKEFDQ